MYHAYVVDGRDRLRLAAVAAAALAAAAAAGCGEEERPVPRVVPDPEHARAVAADPYALTCGDLARQGYNSTTQRLVIQAEFALADRPELRRRVREMTENRVGRSIYWAMTETCRGRAPSFRPGEPAVAAVRRGEYLVQPRPESWSRPELWSR